MSLTSKKESYIKRPHYDFKIFWVVPMHCSWIMHPIHYQKIIAAPFVPRIPHLRGAWFAPELTCQISREELPHPSNRDEMNWKRESYLSPCLSGGGSSSLWTLELKAGGQLCSELFVVVVFHNKVNLVSTSICPELWEKLFRIAPTPLKETVTS